MGLESCEWLIILKERKELVNTQSLWSATGLVHERGEVKVVM